MCTFNVFDVCQGKACMDLPRRKIEAEEGLWMLWDQYLINK